MRCCVDGLNAPSGVNLSMGSVGDCYDNAMAESFFATLQYELLAPRTFADPAEARVAGFEFIAAFYNTKRRHSAIDYLAPAKFEELHADKLKKAARGVDCFVQMVDFSAASLPHLSTLSGRSCDELPRLHRNGFTAVTSLPARCGRSLHHRPRKQPEYPHPDVQESRCPIPRPGVERFYDIVDVGKHSPRRYAPLSGACRRGKPLFVL
jgi:hypothetical protein